MIGQAKRLEQLNRIKRISKKKNSRSKIIAITSGKGGTGKTFISLNIAYSMTRNNKKILLVDLDANLSNLNIMLNITSERNLYHYFKGESSLSSLVYQYDNNLHFLFGDSGRTDHPQLIESKINSLFDSLWQLSSEYDYILLDTAAGAGEDVIGVLKHADVRVVVTTPEPTAVMDAYAILKLLSNKRIKDNKYLLINKSANLMEGKSTFDNLSKAVKHFLKEDLSFIGVVEHDSKVTTSVQKQKLFVLENPNRRITTQLIRISRRFEEIGQMVNNNH